MPKPVTPQKPSVANPAVSDPMPNSPGDAHIAVTRRARGGNVLAAVKRLSLAAGEPEMDQPADLTPAVQSTPASSPQQLTPDDGSALPHSNTAKRAKAVLSEML